MTYTIRERWLFPGYKVYMRFNGPWKWMATFRTKADTDRYVMNLNGAERV